MKFPSRGLYAITPTENRSLNQLLSDMTAVIQGGAVVVQYRDKNPVDATLYTRELVKQCHRYDVPLIINDSIELALLAGADGVHLGVEDGNINDARKQLGGDAIIGVSCYNSIDRAVNAQEQGASYVAIGRFFSSTSKPLAAPAQLSTLLDAKRLLNIPIVAIGGILPENGSQLLDAGADLLAVIGGLYGNDPELAARAYRVLFS